MSTFRSNDVYLSLKIVFILASSADPEEMPDEMWHFIWVYAVCQKACLPLSRMKRVDRDRPKNRLYNDSHIIAQMKTKLKFII